MTLRDEARAALDGVQANPRRSLETARRLLDRPRLPASARVVATWAAGRAHQELGDLGAACSLMAEAGALARDLGDARTAARIDVSRAWALMAAGDPAGAHAALDRADAELGDADPPGGTRENSAPTVAADRARLVMQRGLVQFQQGRLGEAVASFDAALPALDAAADRVAVARLLVNRAAAATALGRLGPAARDLDRAVEVATAAGQDLVVAGALHNRGFLDGRRGDVPGALGHFERAAAAYARLDNPTRLTAVLEVDTCEVLLGAGLVSEARDAAARAEAGFRAAGDTANADEALLRWAEADLAAGDHAAARRRAAAAGAGFTAADRGPWAALAAYVALRAEVAATEDETRPSRDLLRSARRIARDLDRQGWTAEALHARTFAARIAVARGDPEAARRAMAGIRPRATDPAGSQVQAWHGTALVRLADADHRGALAAVRAGLAVVDRHRDSLGSIELRANAGRLGSDLARLALRLALAGGRPAAVLAATERHRAGSLRTPSLRPPADERLAEGIARLRAAEADHRAAVLDGRSDDVAAALTALTDAERRVRDLSRLRRGDAGARFRAPDVRALRGALDGRVLVSYAALDDSLAAVVVERRRTRLVELGSSAAARRELVHLRSAMGRALHGLLGSDPRGAGDDRTANGTPRLTGLRDAARRLDDRLLAPLRLSADAEVVVVPTDFGHAVPWGALPSLHDRPVTVAPSASLWLWPREGRPARRAVRARPPLLVAGPDLPGADAEIAALRRLWPRARTLTGAAATSGAVVEAMSGADLVHLAAHGTFRGDSPAFSSLRLADGPLTVLDLEALPGAPAVAVLPACSAAAVDVRAGDELVGTTAALLGVGVVSVIAPLVRVPDEATVSFSLDLHRHLASGAGAPQATWQAAAARRASGDPLGELVAASFVCVGADDRAV